MESKTQSQVKLLSSQHNSIKCAINNETNGLQNLISQSANNQPLNADELRSKSSIILSRANNPEIEKDFRNTCLLNEENSTSNQEINEAYQSFIKSYHKITSLYIIVDVYNNSKFLVYDTESGEEKELKTPNQLDWGTCMTQIPNGGLFCYGSFNRSNGITLIINSDYEVQHLPSGKSCSRSSAIYFNRSVYCFGGYDTGNSNLSSRFDLDRNRWIELTHMPQVGCWCSTIVFNGHILISDSWNQFILQYSIDTDSFSIISYQFEWLKCKILVNAEERLYLIESGERNGSIYESEIGDEYTWSRIKCLTVSLQGCQVYCSYNKGGIYISSIREDEKCHIKESSYYKFCLDEKDLTLLTP